jgi:5-methylcytosine-specific restriction endonuclease McrA
MIMDTPDLFGYVTPLETWEQKYKEHLSSKYWKDLSKRAFARAGDKCENPKCGLSKYTRKLSVHHLSYDNFGHELLEDVVVLCKPCHDKEDKERAKRTEERSYERFQEARFRGWARKVYGDDWMLRNDEDVINAEYEAWLSAKED